MFMFPVKRLFMEKLTEGSLRPKTDISEQSFIIGSSPAEREKERDRR